ncbi:MAG TPA: HupE/UreJ family protein [Kofleriaceae bacterium]|nr:HupE/UreJ family protein [Kofleriaceae bacterium]
MTPRALTAACVALAGLVAARPAAAHPLDIGYLRIRADGAALSITLDIHVNAAARLLGRDPGAPGARALEASAAELADATFRGAPITTRLGPCRWTTASAAVVNQTASLTGGAECPSSIERGGPLRSSIRALHWAFPFVREARLSPTFQLLVKAQLGGEDRVAIVDRVRPSLELAATPDLDFASFVMTGVEHIGAAPGQWHSAEGWKLPDGIDHILFLLALMLAGGTLFQILGIVSGFTLGHSITLALSALHIARPPASVIEPLIALSIALVAAEALAGRFQRQRWKVAAFFGLIHGFGFAGALNQLELSTSDLASALLGYNLGVELGQIAIVLATAPALLTLHRHRQLRPLARALAALIFVAGVHWFFQRLG